MSAQSTSALQDTFLKHLRDNRVEVTISLATGVRLQGWVKRFDNCQETSYRLRHISRRQLQCGLRQPIQPDVVPIFHL
jgi:Hfq protein